MYTQATVKVFEALGMHVKDINQIDRLTITQLENMREVAQSLLDMANDGIRMKKVLGNNIQEPGRLITLAEAAEAIGCNEHEVLDILRDNRKEEELTCEDYFKPHILN